MTAGSCPACGQPISRLRRVIAERRLEHLRRRAAEMVAEWDRRRNGGSK